jgi:uncharacterized membrane protein
MHNKGFPFAALIIVALAAPAAALLLVVALTVWMAELMGSVIYPCLLLGLLFALLAYIIYKVSLREALREMEQRLQVISDAIALLRTGVEWCVQWLIRS